MKPLKAYYTETVLFLARVAPCLFSKWLRSVAKEYSRREQALLKDLYEKEDKIKTAGLLDGDFKWKAISVVVRLDHKELDSIHKWLKSNASPGNYNPKRDSDSFKSSYDYNGGFRNLGWINFHQKEKLMPLAVMQLNNNISDSCYASISKFSYGINYLSLYIFLNPDANKKVSNVDVTNIKKYYCFSSINPLSKQFRAIEHHDRRNIIEDYINRNIDTVCSDVKIASIELLKLWGIEKRYNDLSLIADIYRDTENPYFDPTLEQSSINRNEANYILIDRIRHRSFDDHISTDSSENFCSGSAVEKNDLDVLYIKSKSSKSFDQFNDFSKKGLTIYDSHIFFSMLVDVAKQYRRISEYSNSALLKNSNKVEDKYDTLFESVNMLESLKNNIYTIIESIPHYCKEAYAKQAKDIANHRLELVDKLKEAIDSRLSRLNNEMQVQNLRFNRRYSLILGFLVILQIILAALTIWLKI